MAFTSTLKEVSSGRFCVIDTRTMHKHNVDMWEKTGWNDYVRGFGDRNGEFWLGLEEIHSLTAGGKNHLAVDIIDPRGKYYTITYEDFYVGDSASSYTLMIGDKTAGNATDEMKYSTMLQKNARFCSYLVVVVNRERGAE